jgi:hypothetical protein
MVNTRRNFAAFFLPFSPREDGPVPGFLPDNGSFFPYLTR